VIEIRGCSSFQARAPTRGWFSRQPTARQQLSGNVLAEAFSKYS